MALVVSKFILDIDYVSLDHIIFSLNMVTIGGLSSDFRLQILIFRPESLVLHLFGVELHVQVIDSLLFKHDFILESVFLILCKSYFTEELVYDVIFRL